MKSTNFIAFVGLLGACTAQSLAPSPTESVGCVPHEDHWHCEAARPSSTTLATEASEAPPLSSSSPTTASSSDEDHDDHDHDDDDGDEANNATGTITVADSDSASASATLAPSPTESTGCSPHGDHWHCEGPATITDGEASDGAASAPATTTTEDSEATSAPAASTSTPVTVNGAPSLGTGLALALGPVAGAILAVML
ncbi:hypothetical protein MKZ38_002712 [Zalerion maritima]|uniref:Uncharacterized protein n=1 Tax=Zalerion maritima TaxID=339359 RepID=A0AAD5WSV4_9PEZI|nr:hypothetical protein MKZ38_002712 [Zalerion maritima]